ncbi:MAG: lysophospholipid acyltransferase family protein [Smithellaceae bacterium]
MTLIRLFQRIIDFCLTVVLWGYFLFGFLIILLVLFLPCYLFAKSSAEVIQKLYHLHMKFFFILAGRLIPHTTYDIDPKVRALRSSVIVCNHLSYLDPILLVSLFPRQTTIIKNTFFRVPVFGWFMKKAGYVSSSPSEMLGPAMINNLEGIKAHLAAGGNLFLFPEGTRSRNGRLGPFNKGVFSIARYCNTGLKLVYIQGTDKLFPPGSFSFKTHEKNTVVLELIASLAPDYSAKNFSIGGVAEQARQIFERKTDEVQAGKTNKKT